MSLRKKIQASQAEYSMLPDTDKKSFVKKRKSKLTKEQILGILAFVVVVLIVTGLIILIVTKSRPAVEKGKKSPFKNVLFILADDLGWSDIGYASGQAVTPTLDRLATEGIILNHTYSYSMCTPSRTSILTGVFAERTGLQHFVLPNSNPVGHGIPLSFRLMPEYFKKYGYSTHIVGKWHTGSCNLIYTPAHRGFDSFLGYFYGEEDYYTHRVSYKDGVSGLDFWTQTKDFLEPILDKNDTYSTYIYNQRAIEIIESHDKSKPLFLFYSSQNPHSDSKFNVPIEYENRFRHIENENRRKILGMVSMLDDSVANLTRSLEENGLLDDTIIVFSSDNGGEIMDFQRNYPLRGGKTTAFEGGHRVRAFVHKKGLLPYVYDGMFHSVDWLPTLLNAATNLPIELDEIDGVSQWNSLVENQPSPRKSFIYNIDPYGSRHMTGHCEKPTESIRDEDWKLIKGCPGLLTNWYNTTDFNPDLKNRDSGFELAISYQTEDCLDHNPSPSSIFNYFLFNIKDDPTEKVNLAKELPCKVKQLEIKLNELRKISVEPFVKEPPQGDPNADPRKWGDKWSPGWC